MPFFRIGLDEFGKFLWRAGHRFEVLRIEDRAAEHRLAEDPLRQRIQLIDDRGMTRLPGFDKLLLVGLELAINEEVLACPA